MTLRLGKDVYESPFRADGTDVVDCRGEVVLNGRTSAAANVVAWALSCLAAHEAEFTDMLELRCRTCDALIISAKVPRHGTDEERMDAIEQIVDEYNYQHRTGDRPQIDKNYIEGENDAYCGVECWRGAMYR